MRNRVILYKQSSGGDNRPTGTEYMVRIPQDRYRRTFKQKSPLSPRGFLFGHPNRLTRLAYNFWSFESIHRLVNVRNDVIRVLQSDREPEQVIQYPEFVALLAGIVIVGDSRGMGNERLDPAE